jgi:hypothetical protein
MNCDRELAREIVKIARILVSLDRWESPNADRRTWRKRNPDGTYEYRDDAPIGENSNRNVVKKNVVKKTVFKSLEDIGGGYWKVKSGKEFRSIVENIKKEQAHSSAVELKDEYPDSWTMLTNVRKDAVVAVKPDGDIVSVAKSQNSEERGWGARAVELAIKHGGKKLDCFDTVLPTMYAKVGMKAVAKLKWNDEYKPNDWDYDLYKDFNNGRPSVIFMVYTGETKVYSSDGVKEVDTYEEGENMQSENMKKLADKKASFESELDMDKVVEETIVESMSRFGWTREKAEKEVAKL